MIREGSRRPNILLNAICKSPAMGLTKRSYVLPRVWQFPSDTRYPQM